MRRIEKKTWPKYFEDVLSGKKNFDLRLHDFDCEVGDILVFKEYDPEKNEYTGREVEKKIGYILKTKDNDFWKKEDIEKHGYIVMELE
jgi:hypothetical protein